MKFILLLLAALLLSRLVSQTINRNSEENPRMKNREYSSRRNEGSTITQIKETKKKVLDSSEAEYAEFEEIEDKEEKPGNE